jgi:hypothetical protein
MALKSATREVEKDPSYGANHLVTATCVQKSYEIKKKSQIYSLLGKCSFSWTGKIPKRN